MKEGKAGGVDPRMGSEHVVGLLQRQGPAWWCGIAITGAAGTVHSNAM